MNPVVFKPIQTITTTRRALYLRWTAALVLILSGLTACGYRTAGKPEIPPDSQTIAVPVFYNQTFEPILENSMTSAVKDEFLTNGRLRVVNEADQADLVLRGTILSYGLTPLSFDQTRSVVLEYRVHIRVRVVLEDSRTQRVLMEEPAMEAVAEYLVHPDTSAGRVAQDQAIEKAGRLFAENVVSRILEGAE
ncbi:MAG TPA: LptE family protein [Nitrospiria bacterium]